MKSGRFALVIVAAAGCGGAEELQGTFRIETPNDPIVFGFGTAEIKPDLSLDLAIFFAESAFGCGGEKDIDEGAVLFFVLESDVGTYEDTLVFIGTATGGGRAQAMGVESTITIEDIGDRVTGEISLSGTLPDDTPIMGSGSFEVVNCSDKS